MKINLKYSILLVLGLVVLYLLFWPSEKNRLNSEMAELCKKDGGVKVYEKVKLPAEMYNSAGILIETKHNTKNYDYGTEYTVEYSGNYAWQEKVIDIKKGNIQKDEGWLTRNELKVIRIVDKKVLAEAIQYSRAGGDRWNTGIPSQSHCPAGPIDLVNKVFSK